eukprot:TRINITY_DN20866_c0_g1_i1.p1 TRINITY_DN20866_c0_g1~~TRINITY_DN20866_c0_g1_i1.p1  ORF type:complete len:211 (+),score=19.93 TRINITY_DN20866_c0_g1_i1:76-708(+)
MSTSSPYTPPTDVQQSTFLKHKFKILEWRPQKAMLRQSGCSASQPWWSTSNQKTSFSKALVVSTGDYEKVILNKLPSVPVSIIKRASTAERSSEHLVEHGPLPRRAAGIKSRANEYPPLPLTVLPPRQKKTRENKSEIPRKTEPRNRRMCTLTQHLHSSMMGGHGKVFDPYWGGRFSKAVGYPKGWKHGSFGDRFGSYNTNIIDPCTGAE